MKILKTILVIFMMVCSNSAYSSEKPIMIVRFNKDRVDFTSALSSVVEMAVQKKTNVFFDIVSLSPIIRKSKAFNRLKEFNNESKRKIGKIESQLISLGISQDKIRTSYQKSPNLKYQEVHIFVR